jgi:serine protease
MVPGCLSSFGRRGFLEGFGALLSAGSGDRPTAERTELIVGTAGGASTAQVATRLARDGPAEIRRIDEVLGFVTLSVPTRALGQCARTRARTLEARDDVAYVEPVRRYWPQTIQTSTSAPSDPALADQYAPQQVNAPQAWRELDTATQRDVTIAVIDQGTAYEHPDLRAQFGSNHGYDSTTIRAQPDEEDCEKKTSKERDDDPAPEWIDEAVGVGLFCRDGYEIHGTHVSGVAAATTAGDGIAGVSDATLLACRAVSMRGGRNDDIAASIRWATDNGADLLNISHGAFEPSETIHNAIKYAREQDVLPICAAGNNAGEVAYPAAFEETVAVAAVDESQEPADFTARGPEIDVAGPGVDVLSSIPTGVPDRPAYERLSGTSMACPAVCGVAALGLAANPDWDAETLATELTASARRIDGVDETFQGAGIPDARRLVGGSGERRFASGDRIATTTSVSVRAAPDTAARRIRVSAAGSTGYVRAGPRSADGYTWWDVAFNAGYRGWCAGTYLEAAPYTG